MTGAGIPVSEVLQMRAVDAEETLFQLGFGCEEPQVTARIPVRFFNFPSQLRGINFRLFLESQLSRIRQEDPCLSLASRFRQVEALTAMANAFYSLYSHVSRTPLQKLAPPQLTFTSPIVERTMSRTSVRSEPRSPVERLKDTISKMCLYTGSRGSDSTSPSNSPRKRKCSLSGVVEKREKMMMEVSHLGEVPFEPKMNSLLCALYYTCPCLQSLPTCSDKLVYADVYVLCSCNIVLLSLLLSLIMFCSVALTECQGW
uniref:Thymocyte expressed, positive selection associated 1 n=1 Tax=Sinocyclocheilus anshuiensis TaxID=1608454 RepID=A0A671PKM7_9TELE